MIKAIVGILQLKTGMVGWTPWISYGWTSQGAIDTQALVEVKATSLGQG